MMYRVTRIVVENIIFSISEFLTKRSIVFEAYNIEVVSFLKIC